MMPFFGCCIKKIEDVRILDFRHCGLSQVPNAVFNAERTIESLHIDSNQIKSLPRELFHCHGLRYLTVSDNDITTIPVAISSLTNIEKLDVSKNGILELPDSLKSLKFLVNLDASVNPLGKLPDGFTQLLNLTQLCLNDCFLEYLPGNFGRLSKLKILELRENHLKTLPQSLSRLTELERLDIGCNEFTELPEAVIATLSSLLEFWCDTNQITSVPKEIGNLKQLMYFDACKNRITELPDEIDGCISLSDLHLSTNLLKTLPHSIGRLSNITTLKVDDNQLLSLPSSLGGLVSLSEFDVSANDLEDLPPTIGLLRHLRTLIADENFLSDIPCELGSCTALTVLSVRSNKLTYLPDEIGRIPRLRVLNLSDNEIKALPYSLMNLKELQALWLAENQSKALIRLQSAIDPETHRKYLTCYLLPQQRMDPVESYGDDNQSFHPSLWEEVRHQRQQIQFKDGGNKTDKNNEEVTSSYPKEMRVMTRHVQNEAMRKNNSNDKTSTNNMEHLVGDVYIGNAPNSPKTATHRLVKLEKEKVAKDKARINRLSQEVNPADVQLALGKQKSPKMSENRHHKPKEHRSSRYSDRESVGERTDSALMNGSLSNQLLANDNSVMNRSNAEPRFIQNGHYHVATTPTRTDPRRLSNPVVYNGSDRNIYQSNRSVERQSSLKGQPYDRYLTHQLKLNQSENTSNYAQSMKHELTDSRPKLSSADTGSQLAVNQEETFGVFASNEDPKLYQRRFKYYQRMRKHRKNPEVQSDLGYYGGQYKGNAGKAASDSGQRMRRPLQQGRDGYDKWDRYSQRSMGDGYASDLEGINYAGKRSQHIPPTYMESHYRSPSRKSLQDSRINMTERPPVPPSYNAAMASRSEVNNVESAPFPPPPPYKPPARDAGPDGASNDGVPRVSPTNEHHISDRDMPFKNYSEFDKSLLTHSTAGNYAPTDTVLDSSSRIEIPASRPHISSTPSTKNSSTIYGTNMIKSTSAHTYLASHRRDVNSYTNYTPGENVHRKSLPLHDTTPLSDDNRANSKSNDYRQRSSFYGGSFQDDNVNDTDYAAQITKSLGRLGYNRESDNKLARPPAQFSNDNTDMVPPPALFSGKDSLTKTDSPSQLYPNNNSLQDQQKMYEPLPNSSRPYTPSSKRRSYQSSSHEQHGSDYQTTNQTSNYSYLPPPSRKSPKLPHKQMITSGIEVEPVIAEPNNSRRTTVTIIKNPGLGFSVAGGIGLQGNPYRPLDEGIFVTKVTPNGAASSLLLPGDKILTVNEHNLTHMEHNEAVNILKNSPTRVVMTIERMLPTDV